MSYARPWYLKYRPGGSGTPLGHSLPGSFFIALAGAILLVALKRARNLPSRTFAHIHIPERSRPILRSFGLVLIGTSTIGIFYEGYEGFPVMAHAVLYLGFFLWGLCGCIEAMGRLPPDSHRGVLVVSFLSSFLLWHRHATMKRGGTDGQIHLLLAYHLNLSNAVTVAYSMRYTNSVIAYVTGCTLMLLQGLWLVTVGFYEGPYDFPYDATSCFCLEIFLIMLVVIVSVAVFGPEPLPVEQNTLHQVGDFTPLPVKNLDGGYQVDDVEAAQASGKTPTSVPLDAETSLKPLQKR